MGAERGARDITTRDATSALAVRATAMRLERIAGPMVPRLALEPGVVGACAKSRAWECHLRVDDVDAAGAGASELGVRSWRGVRRAVDEDGSCMLAL
jgi:hypothetical protein